MSVSASIQQLAAAPALERANPFIRKLERLGELSAEDRMLLATITADVIRVEAGADLLPGEPTAGLLVILEGFACRYILRPGGSRQITSYMVPGDHCDAREPLGVVNPVGTLSACTVAFVSRETIFAIIRAGGAIAQAIRMTTLIEDATLRQWLVNIGRRASDERFAHLFCELYTRLRAVGLANVDSFRMPMTQFDLGDTMGLSYVHVNRTLQSLRQQQLITLKGRVLTILDLRGLQALGEFDPGYLTVRGRPAAFSLR
jgi:CRP-like cAMP-binding protein